MGEWFASRAFLCVLQLSLLCAGGVSGFAPAAMAQIVPSPAPVPLADERSDSGADAPAPTSTEPATPDPALAQANAAIAQRLLQAGQRARCDRAGPDGGIVVCGGREANEKERLPLRDQLESARATRDGLPRAPNVFGIGDIGGVTAKGCFLPPCPPPVMPDIDFAALPEAPADSDADKIARGEIRAP